jgi:hypothetical protein
LVSSPDFSLFFVVVFLSCFGVIGVEPIRCPRQNIYRGDDATNRSPR